MGKKEIEDMMERFSWRAEEMVRGASMSGETDCCAICLDELGQGDVRHSDVVELPLCRHAFHKECMRILLLRAQVSRCPLCQNDVAEAFRKHLDSQTLASPDDAVSVEDRFGSNVYGCSASHIPSVESPTDSVRYQQENLTEAMCVLSLKAVPDRS